MGILQTGRVLPHGQTEASAGDCCSILWIGRAQAARPLPPAARTNVAQPAQASRVKVNIQRLDDRVCMEIRDDGKSLDGERVLSTRGRKRLGLVGLRERVEMAGGSLAVESAPGRGTTLRAQIPFRNGRPVLESL